MYTVADNNSHSRVSAWQSLKVNTTGQLEDVSSLYPDLKHAKEKENGRA